MLAIPFLVPTDPGAGVKLPPDVELKPGGDLIGLEIQDPGLGRKLAGLGPATDQHHHGV